MTNGMDTLAVDESWARVLAAARANRADFNPAVSQAYAFDDSLELVPVAFNDSRACVVWIPATGWASTLSPPARQSPLLDLYLPFASGHAGAPLTFGHLGQSLDGFIATTTGDSCLRDGR